MTTSFPKSFHSLLSAPFYLCWWSNLFNFSDQTHFPFWSFSIGFISIGGFYLAFQNIFLCLGEGNRSAPSQICELMGLRIWKVLEKLCSPASHSLELVLVNSAFKHSVVPAPEPHTHAFHAPSRASQGLFSVPGTSNPQSPDSYHNPMWYAFLSSFYNWKLKC